MMCTGFAAVVVIEFGQLVDVLVLCAREEHAVVLRRTRRRHCVPRHIPIPSRPQPNRVPCERHVGTTTTQRTPI
jgi:hypothetical protein